MGTSLPIPTVDSDKKYFRNWLYRALSEGHKRDVDIFIDNIWKAAQKKDKSWSSNNTLNQIKGV